MYRAENSVGYYSPAPLAPYAQEYSPQVGDAPSVRVRKPYHSSRRRQAWTEEEHRLFLEAIEFHKRDWKKIQEHVATKDVLQIRSHAQKHFSKVERNKTGEYVPPARPKKKASHPYPRSQSTEQASASRAGATGSPFVSPIMSPEMDSNSTPVANQMLWSPSRQQSLMHYRAQMESLRMHGYYESPVQPGPPHFVASPQWQSPCPAHYSYGPQPRNIVHNPIPDTARNRAIRFQKLKFKRRRAEELLKLEGESDTRSVDILTGSTVSKESSDVFD
eukprot:CAMPEP_0184744432 /NCGR_PEP_ID=MMETSP0315-20130426/7192_1 /TAXON_ID=101924 /ORGANISM="Rhodosorus marinus, Strain UTEX LB 2760" /LENGTH=274 /DNA_ID=CAMNT_0027216135 /DNA_START=217 /DNA_END=1041 /DNA_ORIENTATION=+